MSQEECSSRGATSTRASSLSATLLTHDGLFHQIWIRLSTPAHTAKLTILLALNDGHPRTRVAIAVIRLERIQPLGQQPFKELSRTE